MTLPVLADREQRDAVGIVERDLVGDLDAREPRRGSCDSPTHRTMCAGFAGTTIGAGGAHELGDDRRQRRRLAVLHRADAARRGRERRDEPQRGGLIVEEARLRDQLAEGIAHVGHLDDRHLGMRGIAVEQHDRGDAQLGIRQRLAARERTARAASSAPPGSSITDSGLRYGHTRPSSSIATVSSDT